MLQTILSWLSAPHYDDPDEQRRASYVNVILLVSIAALLALIPMGGPGGIVSSRNGLLLGLCIILAFLRYLLGHGRLILVSYILVISMALGLTFLAWSADGVRDVALLVNIIAGLVAALLIGWQAAVAVLGFSILAAWGMAIAETSGALRPTLDTAPGFARDFSAVLVIIGLLIYLFQHSLSSAAVEARSAARRAETANEEMKVLQTELANRVEERTAKLQIANAIAARRVRQLESVSAVAGAIASIRDIDTLLTQITGMISQRFGFYHIGIFLIDAENQFAELRAANSEGGTRMLMRHHRLRLGGSGIVASVATTGRPRIALDVDQDAQFLKNPDLPETRSEMSLPLKVAEKLMGVLDVQSTQESAFSQEDIEVLSTLSNQVALAIENARLFGEARQALANVEKAYHGFLHQQWASFSRGLRLVGIREEDGQIVPIYASDEPALDKPGLSLPIVLHGEVVGELGIGSDDQSRSWSDDEIAVLQAAADRVGLALENARLLEETTARAERERAVAEIANKIRATNDPQAMMDTAKRELRSVLGASSVEILRAGKPASRGDAGN